MYYAAQLHTINAVMLYNFDEHQREISGEENFWHKT
jgi:hypothetical protein